MTETSGDNHLLDVKDLATWFELKRWGFGRAGFVRAVDGVSFDIKRGEAVAVVGESGSGKSTLAKTILGLHRPTRGDILFQGENLRGMEAHRLRWYHSQVGYVQQDPYGALPPFMTLHQILREPLLINKVTGRIETENRVRKALEEVKLLPPEDFLPKFPHMLSGGQQQRVVIARAIILQPKLVVADEPVSMLDASVRVEVLQLLKQLQQAHDLSVLYVTHDLATVRYFSQRVLVMYAGQIIEKSAAGSLLSSPYHPYSKALIAAIPDPDAANAQTFREVPPGEPPSLLNPPAACRFHPRCPSFMSGLCDKIDPPEFEPVPGHIAMCWLYRK
ncbi:MAG: ABC transporter ATP-binding protein [Chloroflexi bacterium]|nr:ABC transporter ATP-binding protein [Chloroflexota bacterium]